MSETKPIRLTQFAHGAGCGCKIAPQVLETILKNKQVAGGFNLLVGNHTNDDAAVWKLNDEQLLISTTDFFTPIVDDAFVFGKIAAANALSDVYAMGGKPIMALSVLGWPVNELPAELAAEVIAGAIEICNEAGIPLAGGHSVDTKEPLFGLCVNGLTAATHLKQNNTAQEGDILLLTKPIGTGILATAAKREKLEAADQLRLYTQLTQLNKVGEALGAVAAVHAMTDVTGFGLLGHAIEMAENSGLSIELNYAAIPQIENVAAYLSQNCIPDATYRNWNAYNSKVQLNSGVNVMQAFQLLPDPQTNGGLLIAVAPNAVTEVQDILSNYEITCIEPIGSCITKMQKVVTVV